MNVTRQEIITCNFSKEEADKLSAVLIGVVWDEGEGSFCRDVFNALEKVGADTDDYVCDSEDGDTPVLRKVG